MRESTLAFLNVCHFPRLPLSKAAPHPPAWASRQEGGGAGRVPWRCDSRPGGSGPLVFNSMGLRATDGTALLRTSPPLSGPGGPCPPPAPAPAPGTAAEAPWPAAFCGLPRGAQGSSQRLCADALPPSTFSSALYLFLNKHCFWLCFMACGILSPATRE